MAIILQFLPDQDRMEPQDLPAMAAALNDVLERLEREDRLRDRAAKKFSSEPGRHSAI